MPKLNQRGAAHLLVPLLLLVGIIVSVYLVQQTQIYKPKASVSKPIGPETSFTLIQSGNPARKCPQIFKGFKWFGFCDVAEENSNVITVSLYARSDIEEANLFAAKLNFPKDLLEVVTIQTNTKGGQICPPPPDCKGGNLEVFYSDGSLNVCPQYFCKEPREPGTICAQVITRACTLSDPPVCKDFPTPCDVPESWIKQGADKILPGSTQAPSKMPTKICETDKDCKEGFIEKWLDTSFDNNNGTISLVGGVSDPGYKTEVLSPPALMAIILFRIKDEGQGKISFNDSSAIYSNKNNINILTIKRDLEVDTSRPKPEPTPAPGACRSDSDCKDGQTCELECGPAPLCPINVEDPNDACNQALEKYRENCIGKCVSIPQPSCKPRPACLDASPRCLMLEPIEGWCPSPLPTTSPKPLPTDGDLNQDKKVDLSDASIFFSKCANVKVFNRQPIAESMCDLNGDGRINSFDLAVLVKLLISNGLITPQK